MPLQNDIDSAAEQIALLVDRAKADLSNFLMSIIQQVYLVHLIVDWLVQVLLLLL